MDTEKLYQANKLQEEIKKLSAAANHACNHHMYLDILLDLKNITKNIHPKTKSKIADLIYEDLREEINAKEKEFNEL